jgi:hypothetical protein
MLPQWPRWAPQPEPHSRTRSDTIDTIQEADRDARSNRTCADILRQGRSDFRHRRQPVLRAPFRGRARGQASVQKRHARTRPKADDHSWRSRERFEKSRCDPSRRKSTGLEACDLWREIRTLQAGRRSADLDFGARARQRLHARHASSPDRRLRDAVERDDRRRLWRGCGPRLRRRLT